MPSRLRVNLVSDTTYSVKEHGVHSVFEETRRCLVAARAVEVRVNSTLPADVTHIHTLGPLGFGHLVAGRGRTIVSAHLTPGTLTGSLVGSASWLGAVGWYLRWFYDRADAVAAVSGEVARELRRSGVEAPVHELPNAVDSRDFRVTPGRRRQARAAFGFDPGCFVVLGVGQLQPRKGIRDFVHCARALPDVQFVWVGGMLFGALSAERGAMRELVRTAPPNLRFVGAVPRALLRDHYAAADLFFLPSLQETFGLVVVEAAAAGLPLLLRDLPLYATTFGRAHLASAGERFTDHIRALQHDDDLRGTWAARATAMATDFDAQAYGDRLLALYRTVATGGGDARRRAVSAAARRADAVPARKVPAVAENA